MLMAVDEIRRRAMGGFEGVELAAQFVADFRARQRPAPGGGHDGVHRRKGAIGREGRHLAQGPAERQIEMQAEVRLGGEGAKGLCRFGPIFLRRHRRGRGEPAGGQGFQDPLGDGGRKGEIVGAKREGVRGHE